MNLCLIAIFKNESHILKEWITHYLNQGVEKFFLIDNGSTDNYFPIIKPFIKKNFIYLVRDIKPHSQIELYNKYFLNLCKKYKWAILCDLDEFIYAKNGFNKISDYLQYINKYRNISLIFIPWKVFGSNGYNTLNKSQPESVIKSFTKRLNYDRYRLFKELFIKENNHIFTYTKCIIKTNYLLKLDIHEHKMLPEFNNFYNFMTTYNSINNIHKNRAFCKINENIIFSSILNLNHYCIQSLDFYSRVKMVRDDAVYTKNDRNLKLFNKYDNNCNEIDDYELSEISNNYVSYDL
jgi:hypothetical protein